MVAPITDLDLIAHHAQQNQDDYEAFRYFVESDALSDTQLDTLVESLAEPILADIDCTTCANCCRHLDVYLTPEDAGQLAEGMLIPLADVRTRYIDHARAEKEGEWGVFRHSPCSFLHDKRCTLYDHRPETCRTYPALTPDFRWSLEEILGGVGLCPIIYNTIEALKEKLMW